MNVVLYHFLTHFCYLYALSCIKSSVQACKGKISPDAHKQYLTLHQKGKMKNKSRKLVIDVLLKQWIAFNSPLQLLFNCLAKNIQTELLIPIKCVLRLDLKGQQQMTFVDCMMLHLRWQ